jgi:photosystem II stability/assembly factor-like uncharacterized protein
MKNTPFLFFFMLTVCCLAISCNKHATTGIISPPHDSTTVYPDSTSTTGSADSLYAWKVAPIGGVLNDIWFTSPRIGFVASNYSNGGAMYESIDSGKTWAFIIGSQAQPMQNLFFYNAQYGFAQGAEQLQITSDGGNTWRVKNLATIEGANFQFVSPATGYYADGNKGVYKTSDTGNTWIQVLPGTSSASGYFISFVDSLTGFTIDGNGDFYATNNQALSWQEFSTGLPSTKPTYCELQFIDPFNGFFASPAGVFKTIVAGVSWNNIFSPGGRVNIVKFFDVDTGYYKSDSAIYKTVNGGASWTTSLKVTRDEITGMHFINTSTGWACTANGWVFRLLP